MSERLSGAVPPPLILLAWAVAGFGLHTLSPIPFLPGDVSPWLSRVPLAVGIALVAWSIFELVRHGTAIDHHHASSRIVTSGPYAWSRNPIYVGLVLLMVGVSLRYESLWALLLVPVATAAIHRLTILREEPYLTRELGAEYERYRARVRRWI